MIFSNREGTDYMVLGIIPVDGRCEYWVIGNTPQKINIRQSG